MKTPRPAADFRRAGGTSSTERISRLNKRNPQNGQEAPEVYRNDYRDLAGAWQPVAKGPRKRDPSLGTNGSPLQAAEKKGLPRSFVAFRDASRVAPRAARPLVGLGSQGVRYHTAFLGSC